MKIGIISINLYTKWLNLACPLHSYAMQQFLLERGYESQIIDYKASYYDNFNMRHPADYYKAKYEQRKNYFPGNPAKRSEWLQSMSLISELERKYRALYQQRASRYDKFQNFIDTRLVKSEGEFNSATMELEDPGYDCYMCVTDVIWKAEPDLERAFFLASRCMDNKHKIAYSASRGSSFTQSKEQEDLFFSYLRDFDAISVREPSLKEHIESSSELKAEVVLDPVLLHDKEFYARIAKEPEEKGYMFLYHVVQSAEDTIEQAVKYAKAHNLIIIESSDRPYPEGKLTEYDVEHKWVYDIGIEEWLGLIMNAECVFTNSFHCCCLSIIFGKRFFAGSRNGDKIDAVLSTFGLESRRFDITTDILACDEEIDYSRVHAIHEKRRKESGDFIISALKACEENPRKPKDYDSERKKVMYPVHFSMNLPFAREDSQGRLIDSPEIRFTSQKAINNGESVLQLENPFLPGYLFKGWHLRCRIDNEDFFFAKKGRLIPAAKKEERLKEIRAFRKGDKIPSILAGGIVSVTADAQWEKIEPTFELAVNSGLTQEFIANGYDEGKGELSLTRSGRLEFKPTALFVNDGSVKLPENKFSYLAAGADSGKDIDNEGSEPDTDEPEEEITSAEERDEAESEDVQTFKKSTAKVFTGWKIRFLTDGIWYWLMNDGSAIPTDSLMPAQKSDIKLFAEGENIPVLPSGLIFSVVAVAQWQKPELTMIYHSGSLKVEKARSLFDSESGELSVAPSGSYEYRLNEKLTRKGLACLAENAFEATDELFKGEFIGWRIRVKGKHGWIWLLENGDRVYQKKYSARKHGAIKTMQPGELISEINFKNSKCIVAEAVWRYPQKKASSKGFIRNLLCKIYKKIF